jgi:hypothetical protein
MRRASLRKTFATGLTLIPSGIFVSGFRSASDTNVNASRRNTVILGFLGSFWPEASSHRCRPCRGTDRDISAGTRHSTERMPRYWVASPAASVAHADPDLRNAARHPSVPPKPGPRSFQGRIATQPGKARSETGSRVKNTSNMKVKAWAEDWRPRGNRHLSRFLCEPSARHTPGGAYLR